MRQVACIAAFLLAVLAVAARAQPTSATTQQSDPRMQWFREARFGMFIHWGIYSVPAGSWEGRHDYSEWIMETAKIPASRYEKFAGEFNPVKFDANEWVRIAKDAGMKYIVITSKHHDGFCMFDTKQTDYNIMHTPFGRDPMKELAAACRAEGIKFCFYHSIMDWHHPLYAPRRAWNDTAGGEPDMDRFNEYVKAELKELLSNFGPLGILWFDGQWEGTWTHERGEALYSYVRSLQPDIIVNDRVSKKAADGTAGAGDYGTPEQEIPATGLPGRDWETCMTMNDHWGYNQDDHHFKSTRDILRMLVDIASKGDNYLLNVGPTAEGLIPRESIDRLREVGRWMHTNGESIYGTSTSPFKSLAWGRATQRAGKVYLHVFDWPSDGKLQVPIASAVTRAYMLADASKQPLVVHANDRGATIDLPKDAPHADVSVIALEIADSPVRVRG